jgi:hypothetical protein
LKECGILKLNPEIINEFLSISYLTEMGNPVSAVADSKCMFVSSIKEAIKLIDGTKWENVRCERNGDVSSFLCLKHRDEYRLWNSVAEAAKIGIVPGVVEKIERLPIEPDFIEPLITNIKYDVVGLAIIAFYREYISLNFHAQLLQIYKSGHLPCGWKGKGGKGYFLIY